MCKSLLAILLILFSASLGFSQDNQAQYMKIHRNRIVVNDSLCYQVRKGFSWRDTTPWVPFCGKFSNLWCEEGYQYTLQVKEYDPHADTIHVIKTIARDDVRWDCQQEMAWRKEKRHGSDTNQEYMKVYLYRVKCDTNLCYQVMPGYCKKPNHWTIFCGVFENFEFEEGKEHTLLVKKYDPSADTIHVVKMIK